jgi:hypothetical protein
MPVEGVPRRPSSGPCPEDRPWAGLDPVKMAHVYAPDRTADRLFSYLAGFEASCSWMLKSTTRASPGRPANGNSGVVVASSAACYSWG